jgi:hypothetical protein
MGNNAWREDHEVLDCKKVDVLLSSITPILLRYYSKLPIGTSDTSCLRK